MQPPHNARHLVQCVAWHTQPLVERVNQTRAYFFAWVRLEVAVRLSDNGFIRRSPHASVIAHARECRRIPRLAVRVASLRRPGGHGEGSRDGQKSRPAPLAHWPR